MAYSGSGAALIQSAAELGDVDLSNFQWACVSVFQPWPADLISIDGGPAIPMPIILGAPFVRAFYTVFRRDGPGQGSIGIARKA